MEKNVIDYVAKRTNVNAGSRTVSFIISNGQTDRQGDTVNPLGWHLKNYLANPVVLWGHNKYDAAAVIGKCLSIEAKADGLYATAQFATKEENPQADTIFQLIKGGYLNTVSVGFLPVEWSYTDEGRKFDQQELLEFSVVTIPANPGAFAIARGEGIDLNPLADGLIRSLDASQASSQRKAALSEAYFEARKCANSVYDKSGIFMGTLVDGALAVSPEYQNLLAKRNLKTIGVVNPPAEAKGLLQLRAEQTFRALSVRVRTA